MSVLLCVGGELEVEIVRGLTESSWGVAVERRCADVAELLAAAEAGIGAVCVLREWDLVTADRLHRCGLAIVGIVGQDEGGDPRLRGCDAVASPYPSEVIACIVDLLERRSGRGVRPGLEGSAGLVGLGGSGLDRSKVGPSKAGRGGAPENGGRPPGAGHRLDGRIRGAAGRGGSTQRIGQARQADLARQNGKSARADRSPTDARRGGAGRWQSAGQWREGERKTDADPSQNADFAQSIGGVQSTGRVQNNGFAQDAGLGQNTGREQGLSQVRKYGRERDRGRASSAGRAPNGGFSQNTGRVPGVGRSQSAGQMPHERPGGPSDRSRGGFAGDGVWTGGTRGEAGGIVPPRGLESADAWSAVGRMANGGGPTSGSSPVNGGGLTSEDRSADGRGLTSGDRTSGGRAVNGDGLAEGWSEPGYPISDQGQPTGSWLEQGPPANGRFEQGPSTSTRPDRGPAASGRPEQGLLTSGRTHQGLPADGWPEEGGAWPEDVEASASIDLGAEGRSARGKIVAVWGTGGAPGRSTLARDLAFAIAPGQSVLLVDADTRRPCLAQLLGAERETSALIAVTRRLSRGDPGDVLRECAVPMGGVDFLAGLNSGRRWREVPGALMDEMWRRIGLAWDVAVVDCAAECDSQNGVLERDAATRSLLDHADVVLCLGRASPVGVRRLLESLDESVAVFGMRPVPVIRRAGAAKSADVREIADILAAKDAGEPLWIREDVGGHAKAEREGMPLLEAAPSSPTVRDIAALAERLGLMAPAAPKRRWRLRRASGRR